MKENSAEYANLAIEKKEFLKTASAPLHWGEYQQRYLEGEQRSRIFCDMICSEAERLRLAAASISHHEPQVDHLKGLTLLDIGCGGGFDHKPHLQKRLAAEALNYIGIEPDPEIELDSTFTETHHTSLEAADIKPNSVDLAFSVMVLEHVEHPDQFWMRVHQILKPGGVFWGFTVDARHWFVSASSLLERLGLKTLYLNLLHGKRGEERYENYGVYYQSNTVEQIEKLTKQFSSSEVINFTKLGQMDFYLPRGLKWFGRLLDRYALSRGKPGAVIAIRVEK